MRAPIDILAEINTTRARLHALVQEHRDARQAEIDAVVRMFDAGASCSAIALSLRMPRGCVAGILQRASRTEAGRSKLRAIVARHCEQAST